MWGSHLDYTAALAKQGIKQEIFRNSAGTYKAPGVLGSSLTDEQRERIQAEIDADFAKFKAGVTSARPRIPDDALRGQTYSGAGAVRLGFADAVGSRAEALALLRWRLG